MNARSGTGHPHRREPYPASVRASAVAAAQEGLAEGRSVTALAREMELPLHTLQRWLARERAGFRPVTVVADISQERMVGGLVLHTARGHRLEGLDLASAITLLRALEAAG
jgi:transposase-like protein